jgi:outer membrane scaffolding protein for murein synthesis (MipA/OmpV family)
MRASRAARPAVAALAGLATLAVPAHAELPLWELGLGLGSLSLPHYRGSEQSHRWVLPIPYGVYRGDILKADRDGARAVLVDRDRVDVDLSLAGSAPTDSSDNRARSGMADLPPTIEFGPNLNLRLAQGTGWKLQARLPLRAVFSLRRDSRPLGFTASPVINLDLRWQGWNLGLQGGPLAATRRYHEHYYGVAAADATATRPAYAARGGYAGWQATLAASRRAGDWWLGAFVRQDSVAGAVFDASPLVTQRRTWAAGLAFSRVFAVSDQRVADDR